MDLAEFVLDPRFVTEEDAVSYLRSLRGRDRRNHRRIQAWFDHCARIRSHLGALPPVDYTSEQPEAGATPVP